MMSDSCLWVFLFLPLRLCLTNTNFIYWFLGTIQYPCLWWQRQQLGWQATGHIDMFVSFFFYLHTSPSKCLGRHLYVAFLPFDRSWENLSIRLRRRPWNCGRSLMIPCSSYQKKRGQLWLVERKEEIIGKLNQDFVKPWFEWKKDGSVATDLSDMC